MLTMLLGRMYIIFYATAALGTGNVSTTPGSCVKPRHIHHPHLPLPLPPECSPSRLPFAFHHFSTIPISPHPTPHGLCFDALAPVLRIRAAYHCRGLRAPLHISGTDQGDLPLAVQPRCFWDCILKLS